METLKEFWNILLGQQILVHIDDQNLTYKKFNSDRLVHWRLYIEEYSPDLRYIKGPKNVVADALSRLELTDEKVEDSLEAFSAIMQDFGAEEADLALHPVSYAKLAEAQKQDPQIRQKLKADKYTVQEFVGGRED